MSWDRQGEPRGDIAILAKEETVYGKVNPVCNACKEDKKFNRQYTHMIMAINKGGKKSRTHYAYIPSNGIKGAIFKTFCDRAFYL